MDLPQLNILRPSNVDAKSKNDVTGDLSQLIPVNELNEDVISDLDDGGQVFKFNIDENAFE